MSVTAEILAELERLEKEATPAPWCIHPNGTSLWQGDEWTGNQLGTIQRHICNATGAQEQHAIDLELLCEARNHLPALIAAAREREHIKRELRRVYRAQAAALRKRDRGAYFWSWGQQQEDRARSLIRHWIAKFERMAADCGEEMG